MGLVHQDSGEARVLGHGMPAEQIAAKGELRRKTLLFVSEAAAMTALGTLLGVPAALSAVTFLQFW